MPSSSATCSTTTVSTSASRSARVSRAVLDRPAEQHQPGRGGAAAADQRRQRHLAALPVVGDLRRVLDGVLHQAEPVLPAPVDAGHDGERQVVEPLARGSAAPGLPGCRGSDARARASRGRAGRGGRPGRLRPRPRVRPRASLTGQYRDGTVACVSPARRCSRTACDRPAVTTLTYVYADQTAVLGPLATYAEPHAYDLCDAHGERLSAPRGLGGAPAGLRPRRRAARPTTTCSRWPTPSARPPARCRPRSAPPADRARLPRDLPPRPPAGPHPRRVADAR